MIMYRALDDTSVFTPRLYRTPDEIRKDINEVRERIDRINGSLNVRELISGLIDADELNAKKCDELTELLAAAIETLRELKLLNHLLDQLKAELLEVVYGWT